MVSRSSFVLFLKCHEHATLHAWHQWGGMCNTGNIENMCNQSHPPLFLKVRLQNMSKLKGKQFTPLHINFDLFCLLAKWMFWKTYLFLRGVWSLLVGHQVLWQTSLVNKHSLWWHSLNIPSENNSLSYSDIVTLFLTTTTKHNIYTLKIKYSINMCNLSTAAVRD